MHGPILLILLSVMDAPQDMATIANSFRSPDSVLTLYPHMVKV